MRVYNIKELQFIELQIAPRVEQYLGYYVKGCSLIDITEDFTSSQLVLNIFKSRIGAEVTLGQVLNLAPLVTANVIKEKLKQIYVNDILLNPLLLK